MYLTTCMNQILNKIINKYEGSFFCCSFFFFHCCPDQPLRNCFVYYYKKCSWHFFNQVFMPFRWKIWNVRCSRPSKMVFKNTLYHLAEPFRIPARILPKHSPCYGNTMTLLRDFNLTCFDDKKMQDFIHREYKSSFSQNKKMMSIL